MEKKEKNVKGLELISLGEALEKIDADITTIKLCSKGGTGFFFIGTKEQFFEGIDAFDTAEIRGEIERVYNTHVDYFENKHVNRENEIVMKIAQNLDDIIKLAEKAKTMEIAGEDFKTMVDSGILLTNFLKSCVSRLLNLSWIHFYKNSIPENFLDRCVLEAYMADPIIDKDSIILKIEGNENGGFWMKSEAERDSFSLTGFTKNKEGFKEKEGDGK